MMQKHLKSVIFVLLFMIMGYIYRTEFKVTTKNKITFLSERDILKTFKALLISSQEDNKTFWNNNNLFAMNTVRTTKLSRAPSSLLNAMDILRAGNGIIFMETTDRMQPSSLVKCAIESAARVYKDRPVLYFMKGLTETNSDEAKKKYFPIFMNFSNIYFLPLKMQEVFAETPLLPWYQKVDPSKEVYWTHVSSDGCRLALIWKFGGIYMDSDIISMRQIPNQNFLAAQSNKFSSNGVMGFSSHHIFTWKSMEDFVRNYQGAVWGHQGPYLFTRILNTFCKIHDFRTLEDIKCGNISFLHPERFYPIPYVNWKRYYEVWTNEPTFDNSYALHLWNYMNSGQHKDVIPRSNSLVEHLYQHYCPTTYGDLVAKKTNP